MSDSVSFMDIMSRELNVSLFPSISKQFNTSSLHSKSEVWMVSMVDSMSGVVSVSYMLIEVIRNVSVRIGYSIVSREPMNII